MENMPNAAAINQLHTLLDQLLADCTSKDWHGELTLSAKISDGIIQVSSFRGETRRIRISKDGSANRRK